MTTYNTDSAGRSVIDKDPDAILDYSIDLTDWLTDSGDTLQNLQVIVNGCTLMQHSFTGAICTAWLAGGTEGQLASCTFRFSTVGGRVDDRTVYLKIKSR